MTVPGLMLLSVSASPVAIAGAIGIVTLSLGLAISFARLVIGPTLADRVVALDMLATLLVGLIALDSIIDTQPEFMRVATVLALVNFLGTVAFAIYIDRKVN
jgi:multicomponent Na+:H+ antiporter subunit F